MSNFLIFYFHWNFEVLFSEKNLIENWISKELNTLALYFLKLNNQISKAVCFLAPLVFKKTLKGGMKISVRQCIGESLFLHPLQIIICNSISKRRHWNELNLFISINYSHFNMRWAHTRAPDCEHSSLASICQQFLWHMLVLHFSFARIAFAFQLFFSSFTSPCSGNVTDVRFLPLMLHTYFTQSTGHREPSGRQIMSSSCCWCCFIQEASEKSYQPLLKISHLSLFGVCSKGLPFFVEQRRWPHCSRWWWKIRGQVGFSWCLWIVFAEMCL